MQKEIGSNFDLNFNSVSREYIPLHLTDYGISGTDSAFFSSGRSAEAFVLKTIKERNPAIKKIALVPPFTCHTVLDPFYLAEYEVYSYSINEKLEIKIVEFEEALRKIKPSVVLVHRYFGFDTTQGIDEIIHKYQQLGIVFVEDKTQCLFSEVQELFPDFYVGSFRKWLALPDGGYTACKEGHFFDKPELENSFLVQRKISAFQMKYEYLHNNKGIKQEFLKALGEAEEILDKELHFFRMSKESERILGKLKKEQITKKRRENYKFLYEKLCCIQDIRIVTPILKDGEVPLYMAISTTQREQLQAMLRKENIYAPIVWPKAKRCPDICEEAQILYDTILCIPIDQRYDMDDMERIAMNIERYFYA